MPAIPAPTTQICGVRPLGNILLIILDGPECLGECELGRNLGRLFARSDIELGSIPVMTDGCKPCVCAEEDDPGR